jgi:hypothetical protein
LSEEGLSATGAQTVFPALSGLSAYILSTILTTFRYLFIVATGALERRMYRDGVHVGYYTLCDMNVMKSISL